MDISLITSKIEGFAKRVGRSTARTPLLLYYVLQSKDTSTSDKAIIAACLAYLILPIDLIPSSKFSIFGWADEILSVEIVYDRMRKYITSEMYAKAEEQLDRWIPNQQPSQKTSNTTPIPQNPRTGASNGSNSHLSASQQHQVEEIVKKWKK